MAYIWGGIGLSLYEIARKMADRHVARGLINILCVGV
jgi:hypothetical protein